MMLHIAAILSRKRVELKTSKDESTLICITAVAGEPAVMLHLQTIVNELETIGHDT